MTQIHQIQTLAFTVNLDQLPITPIYGVQLTDDILSSLLKVFNTKKLYYIPRKDLELLLLWHHPSIFYFEQLKSPNWWYSTDIPDKEMIKHCFKLWFIAHNIPNPNNLVNKIGENIKINEFSLNPALVGDSAKPNSAFYNIFPYFIQKILTSSPLELEQIKIKDVKKNAENFQFFPIVNTQNQTPELISYPPLLDADSKDAYSYVISFRIHTAPGRKQFTINFRLGIKRYVNGDQDFLPKDLFGFQKNDVTVLVRHADMPNSFFPIEVAPTKDPETFMEWKENPKAILELDRLSPFPNVREAIKLSHIEKSNPSKWVTLFIYNTRMDETHTIGAGTAKLDKFRFFKAITEKLSHYGIIQVPPLSRWKNQIRVTNSDQYYNPIPKEQKKDSKMVLNIDFENSLSRKIENGYYSKQLKLNLIFHEDNHAASETFKEFISRYFPTIDIDSLLQINFGASQLTEPIPSADNLSVQERNRKKTQKTKDVEHFFDQISDDSTRIVYFELPHYRNPNKDPRKYITKSILARNWGYQQFTPTSIPNNIEMYEKNSSPKTSYTKHQKTILNILLDGFLSIGLGQPDYKFSYSFKQKRKTHEIIWIGLFLKRINKKYYFHAVKLELNGNIYGTINNFKKWLPIYELPNKIISNQVKSFDNTNVKQEIPKLIYDLINQIKRDESRQYALVIDAQNIRNYWNVAQNTTVLDRLEFGQIRFTPENIPNLNILRSRQIGSSLELADSYGARDDPEDPFGDASGIFEAIPEKDLDPNFLQRIALSFATKPVSMKGKKTEGKLDNPEKFFANVNPLELFVPFASPEIDPQELIALGYCLCKMSPNTDVDVRAPLPLFLSKKLADRVMEVLK